MAILLTRHYLLQQTEFPPFPEIIYVKEIGYHKSCILTLIHTAKEKRPAGIAEAQLSLLLQRDRRDRGHSSALSNGKLFRYCSGFRPLSNRETPKGITAPAYAIVMSLRLQIRFIFEYN